MDISKIDYYENNEIKQHTFYCYQCSKYFNINLNTSIDEYSFNELEKNYSCDLCISFNALIFTKQELYSCLNDNTNKIYHILNDNKFQFNSSKSKIYDQINISKSKIYDQSNQINILNKNLFDFKIKVNHFIDDYHNLKNKSIDNQENLIKDIKNLNKLLDDKKTNNSINEDEDMNKYDEKLDQLSEIIQIQINNQEDNNKKYYEFRKDIIQIQMKNNQLNKNCIDYFNTCKEEFKQLNFKIKSLESKNKEFKELDELKKSLVLNDREYKKFKIKINNFDKNENYIYLLVVINILLSLLLCIK